MITNEFHTDPKDSFLSPRCCHSSFDMSRMCARTGRGRPTIDSPPDPLIPHPPPYPTPGPSHPPPLPK